MLGVAGFAAALSLALTPLVARLAERLGALDAPGPRRPHAGYVPRLGGLAVVASAAVALLAAPVLGIPEAGSLLAAMLPILAGTAVIFAVGLWDDLRGLAPGVKLAFQSAAAALVVASGASIERVVIAGRIYELGVLAPLAALVWIVVLTNAFNLIDGLDGLATGVALISGATCAFILLRRGHRGDAALLAALLGGGLGFLPHNLGRTRIFLGDGGSLVFGFVLAVTSITGLQKGATALSASALLLLFAIPILETVSSVARRSVRGARRAGLRGLLQVVVADREHIHHRLVAAGLAPRTVVAMMYGVTIAVCALALALAQLPD